MYHKNDICSSMSLAQMSQVSFRMGEVLNFTTAEIIQLKTLWLKGSQVLQVGTLNESFLFSF